MKTLYSIIILLLLSSLSINAKSLRIQKEELSKNLNQYIILDTRTNKRYLKGHIKNALNFPVSLTYQDKSNNGKVTSPQKMQVIIRELGLKINDPIIIYDNGTFFDAARLFWTLEVYGFSNVKLLNAGYSQWKEASYLIQKKIRQIEASDYIVRVDSKRLATKFTTQIATLNPNVEILDARLYNAYLGKESKAKRFGHIKSAKYLSASHNIDYTQNFQALKEHSQLKETYKDIAKNKKVVVYCDIGRVAAMNYFALRELGYDVSNYDASWKEWGNDHSLPITNLSK